MPTQQEIKDAEARFASLPEEEQKRVLAEQRDRRNEAQMSVYKLQFTADLLNLLANVNTDQGREYIKQLGEAGPGKASDELLEEIRLYCESAQMAQLNDLGSLAGMLSAEQIADALKADPESFTALLAAEVVKRD